MRSLLKRKTLHYLLKFHHCFKKQKGSFLYKEKRMLLKVKEKEYKVL